MKKYVEKFGLIILVISVQFCLSATQGSKTAAAKKKRPVAASTVSKKRVATRPKPVSNVADSSIKVDSTDTSSSAGAEEQIPQAEPTADYYRRLGDMEAKKGRIEKAMEAYRKCLELSSEDDTANGRIFFSLGKYCFQKKEYKEALDYFSKAKVKASDRLQFSIMLAEALHLTGNNDSAIAVLTPFATDPKLAVRTNIAMFKIMGDAFFAKDSSDKAVKWYGKYLQLGGTQTSDIAYLMACNLEKSAPAKAKLAFEANIKKFPNDYRNYLKLAKINARNRATLQTALSLLKKASQLADTIPRIWIEIGRVYGSLGRKDEEVEAYRNCLNRDPENVDAMICIGGALVDRGWVNDAVNHLEKAYHAAPENAAVINALSIAYIKSGNPQKAIEPLVKLKSVQPKNIEGRKRLIEAYTAVGEEAKAINEINEALEIDRDYELLLSGGKLLVKQGKYDDAVVMLEELIGIMPENIDALMTMAKAKRGQQKHEEAIEIYKEIVVYNPKYAPALYERAEVHMEQNKIKWAETFYQRALEADPKFALAEVGLAKVAQLYKKNDEFYMHLRRAESMAPNDPEVQAEIEKVRKAAK